MSTTYTVSIRIEVTREGMDRYAEAAKTITLPFVPFVGLMLHIPSVTPGDLKKHQQLEELYSKHGRAFTGVFRVERVYYTVERQYFQVIGLCRLKPEESFDAALELLELGFGFIVAETSG